MATTDEKIQGLRFVGRSCGAVKTLSGFSKGRHTVPDAVNATTLGFLAKLAATELSDEAEGFFQRCRTAFAYKRKEIALEVSPPTAVLNARDFALELSYSFLEDDPSRFEVTRSLQGAVEIDFLRGEGCAAVFAGQFTELVFALTKGAPVEAVIDAVEGLEGERGLEVTYPSDCAHCLLSVEGVDAEVRFDGAEMAMVFPRAAAPGELLDGFLAVRSAFRLSEEPALAGLVAG